MKNGLTREEKKNWEKQLLLEISLQNHCCLHIPVENFLTS